MRSNLSHSSKVLRIVAMGGPRSDPREVPPTMVSENPVAIEIIEIGDAASVAFWGHV
jgi:hypothetical protein